MATTISLPFTDIGGGILKFTDSTFLPIDGQLFGNQGRSHNYHFTMEIHRAFTCTPDQAFSFTGDDDLWAFVNGQLVIDLGGVHGAASGSVDLDTLGLTDGTLVTSTSSLLSVILLAQALRPRPP